ncbi:diacylglycerol kinase [Lacticaseibacillus kribbianus]|uniref:diacylglycerol kinase n=1 Tax=Lacticaseibacillus kribbianus TaxID=2926292 RepID=UPI001CD28DD0|nr:diacylglycerol kinase [Lacticaseibacillus kribbianus]
MLYWILAFIAFGLLYVLSSYFLAWLKKRHIKISRWIWAFASFLVVIIPYAIWPHMNPVGTVVVFSLCGVFALNFMIEQHAFVKEHDRIF